MSEIEVRFVVRSAKNKLRLKKSFFLSIQPGNELFGSFLAKYGETILKRLSSIGIVNRFRKNDRSFPMKLSVKSSQGEQVFDRENRSSRLNIIPGATDIVLLLERIPPGEEDNFSDNVDPTNKSGTDSSSYIDTKYYTGDERDPNKVLNVVIEYNSSGQPVKRVMFHLLKTRVQGISHGMFLSKYGNDILKSFGIDLMPPESSNFPMELKFYDVFDMGERFDNFNRDELLTWNKNYSNRLILLPIDDGDKDDFNQNVTNDENIHSECSFCFDELYNPVHISEYMVLPQFKEFDSVSFPCNHRFHTHCVLKSCQYRHMKCIRCTRDPGQEFWGRFYSDAYRAVNICFTTFNSETLEMKQSLKDKQEQLVEIDGGKPNLNHQPEAPDLELSQTTQPRINDEIFKLTYDLAMRDGIHKTIEQELAFLASKTTAMRAQFQQETSLPLRINRLNQLDALLQRFLENRQ